MQVPRTLVREGGDPSIRTTETPVKNQSQPQTDMDCIMSEKQFYVYLLASKKYGTLYTGVTSNLAQRVYQHQESLVSGFTKKYNISQLVYYEVHLDIYEAITREKRIKKWNRQWKINLIEQGNPQWLNLANGLF